jgi:hypothetical protein
LLQICLLKVYKKQQKKKASFHELPFFLWQWRKNRWVYFASFPESRIIAT